jgi:hypothetical protein
MMSDTKDVSMDLFLNFPYVHLFFSLLKPGYEGFKAVWLSIAGECAKPNLKYLFDFLSWQINPEVGQTIVPYAYGKFRNKSIETSSRTDLLGWIQF